MIQRLGEKWRAFWRRTQNRLLRLAREGAQTAIGSALIAAKAAETDPFAAIEEVVPWAEFTASGLASGEALP